MRVPPFLATLFVVSAVARAGAQCSPGVDKLVTDQRYDEARAAVQALLAANAKDDKALHCMGAIYETQGKLGDATDWYEKAIKADEKNPQHHLSLAGAYGEQARHANRFRQALLARRIKSELEQTVAIDSNLVDAHDGLMQFYLEAPGFLGGSADKAKEQMHIIEALSPFEGHLARAKIARQGNDLGTAEAEYKAAIDLDPDSLGVWYALGALYENQKRWPDAAALYDRMIARAPNNLRPHYLYGRLAALSGEDMERGEREIRYWLASAPLDAPIVTRAGAHLRLGMIFERQGKTDAARTEYQVALSINSHEAEAKRHLDALK
ncbi:MAG: tetratricopeptide repeat protein [Gemmatimonadales bacterium]